MTSLSFGIANCISATCASKQIYGELVRDPMRAIPDPFKKLGEKNFRGGGGGGHTMRTGQPDSFSPPTFFMLLPPLIIFVYQSQSLR